jgi:hypothetical protein
VAFWRAAKVGTQAAKMWLCVSKYRKLATLVHRQPAVYIAILSSNQHKSRMKSKHLRLATITLLLATACHKYDWSLGDYWEGFQENGFATAERNGDEWKASGFGIFPDGGLFYLGFSTYHPIDSVPTESLSFNRVPFEIGRFSVYKTEPGVYDILNSGYNQRYDDLPAGIFNPDESKSNWIEVESLDTAQRIVRGSFDVHYRIDPRSKDTGFPRTVHLKNGRFEVRLE